MLVAGSGQWRIEEIESMQVSGGGEKMVDASWGEDEERRRGGTEKSEGDSNVWGKIPRVVSKGGVAGVCLKGRIRTTMHGERNHPKNTSSGENFRSSQGVKGIRKGGRANR